MERSIPYTTSTGEEGKAKIEKYPDQCPVCEHGIESRFMFAYIGVEGRLQAVFVCPRSDCRYLFFAFYRNNNPRFFDYMHLQRVMMIDVFEPDEFPEIIKKISKEFPRIYNQAMIAEKNGLDQICGPGYRKAVEFLMKDYAIHLEPDKAEEIKKKFLGDVIKDIPDPQVQACAKRATWVGNDETHYIRVWEEKDLTNMKDLIRLTVNWIENVELSKKYEEDMPDSSK